MPVDYVHPNSYASTDYTPTTLFEHFFDDEIILQLVKNTNKYAMQKGKHSFQTTPSEFRLFLAILFNSGYAPLPRRRLYWEPMDDVHNAAISNAMTRNHFEELMSYVHVADNENLAVGDRFAKVRPLFTVLNKKFLDSFSRQRNISIDESMVPYYSDVRRSIKNPTIFEGLEAMYQTFEVPQNLYAKLLMPFLSLKAKTLISRLCIQELDDYEGVRDFLLSEFKLTPREYKLRFDNATKRPHEMFIFFTARLRNNLRYYLRS